MAKPLRIYLSSTFRDLEEHRRAVRDAIGRAGQEPVMMEQFGASPEAPLDVCRHYVERSDVVLLVLGHRYGAVLPGRDESVTEFEYNSAREAGIPVLAFILDDDYPWPVQLFDSGDAALRLKTFKKRLQSELVVGRFTSPSDLSLRALHALYAFRSERGLEPAETPAEGRSKGPVDGTGDEFVGRIEDHLNHLRATMSEMRDQLEQVRAGSSAATAPMIQPAPFLGPSAKASGKGLCFVAMPYSRSWSEALESILLDICRDSAMELLIAKDMDGRFVPHDIWRGITGADVIIADITDGNPNVAYEIGLADVLGKEVVLLCQGSNVPFDFLGQRLICYEDTMKGAIVLREELTARLRRVRDRLKEA